MYLLKGHSYSNGGALGNDRRARQNKLWNYGNYGITPTWIARQSELPVLCYHPNTVIRPNKGKPAQKRGTDKGEVNSTSIKAG